MKKIIEDWKYNNGFNYKGWWKVFIIHKLIKYKLMWIIPFYYSQDGYDDGIQIIDTWTWGKYKEKRFQWFRYEHDIFYKMSDSGKFNKKQMYRFIKLMAKNI